MKRRPNSNREHGPGRRVPKPGEAARTAQEQGSVVYGLLPVLEAVRGEHRRVDKVLVAEGSREGRFAELKAICRERSIPFDLVPRVVIDRHTGPDVNHQGVVAIVSAAAYVGTDDVLDNAADPALIVILDGVEDPRNLGAILRTAETAGVDGVVIPERRAVGLTETVARSSAGAIEFVKVAKAANLNNLIEELKERGIWVVGAGGDGEIEYTDWDWTRPSALVLGGEGSGLHRLVAKNCDVLVKIPMYGRINSLNVSVAAGVILFEAKRQRRSSAVRSEEAPA